MDQTSRTGSPFALVVGGFAALAAAMGIGRFVYTPILPFMAAGVPLSEAEAGWIASANYLGYLVGALVASAGGLPGGKRGWFLSGLFLSAATSAAMAVTETVSIFALFRFLSGLASAFALIFATSLVFDRLTLIGRQDRSHGVFAGVGFGIAVSAVLVTGLARADAGWPSMWLASGALTLLAAAICFLLLPEGPETRPLRPSGTARPDGRLLRLVIGYGLFGFGYVITATFINAIVRAEPALSFLEETVWLIVGLAGIPSVALWMLLARRIGTARAVALACLVEAVGVALSVISTAPAAMIAAAILLGGTFMAITALGLGHARTLSAGDPRRVVALMTAAFGLGQMIGPAFAGWAHGFGESFLLPSLAAALALVIASGLIWRTR